jgi:hypothetical protein
MIFEVVPSGGERMRAIAVVAVAGRVLLSCARPLAASEPTVACALLTPAQIGAATGANIGAGSPIAAPTSCQWMGQGKAVTLTINQPRAGKSPIEQFNAGKASKMITAEDARSGCREQVLASRRLGGKHAAEQDRAVEQDRHRSLSGCGLRRAAEAVGSFRKLA